MNLIGDATILLLVGGLVGWVAGAAIGFLIPVNRRWLALAGLALALVFCLDRGWFGSSYDLVRWRTVFDAGMLAVGPAVGFFAGSGRGLRLRARVARHRAAG